MRQSPHFDTTLKELLIDMLVEMPDEEFNSYVNQDDYLHWIVDRHGEDALAKLLIECSPRYRRLHALAISLYISGLPEGTDERLREMVEIASGKIIL